MVCVTCNVKHRVVCGRYPVGDESVLGLYIVDLDEPVYDVWSEIPQHTGQQKVGEGASAHDVPAPVVVQNGCPVPPVWRSCKVKTLSYNGLETVVKPVGGAEVSSVNGTVKIKFIIQDKIH